MKNEVKSVLRNDFMSFARKAIRELDGTRVGEDYYLLYFVEHANAVC